MARDYFKDARAGRPDMGNFRFSTSAITLRLSQWTRVRSLRFRNRRLQENATPGPGKPSPASHFKHTQRPKDFEQSIHLIERAPDFYDPRIPSKTTDTRAQN